ncbi:hypothetical protein CR513_18308 [Mucuna pruriens]|uniref:AB hydrolase-1 domain-containing protein n=1 Tax=Mucuna pruriens TaxID=157652 RepID=A0A371H7I7_MUCPR|nr:hypothetical protein CR513_18308 [Mucuna pruriens]
MAVCVSGPHTLLANRSNLKTVAVLSRENKMRVQYDLKQGQSRNFHELPSGLSMEVIVQKGAEKKKKNVEYPPLVFVHGSYHAAWCWAEHWLPFFSSSGHDCYALSLLGQGESDAPADSVVGTLQQTHARDVADFICRNIRSPPVLVGHSFGGLIIQYYVSNLGGDKLKGAFIHLLTENEELYPKLKGAVLVCSVPPSGNSWIVWRYVFTKPIAAFKVTCSLAAKAFQTSLSLCKETFFSATMEDHVVKRYQELMKESCRMPLFDLRKLNASLPVPSVPNCPLEILVMGAKDDFIVDAEGLKETAKFYGVSPVCVEAVAHDMMLDVSWEKGAEVIHSWLNGLEKRRSKLQGPKTLINRVVSNNLVMILKHKTSWRCNSECVCVGFDAIACSLASISCKTHFVFNPKQQKILSSSVKEPDSFLLMFSFPFVLCCCTCIKELSLL